VITRTRSEERGICPIARKLLRYVYDLSRVLLSMRVTIRLELCDFL